MSETASVVVTGTPASDATPAAVEAQAAAAVAIVEAQETGATERAEINADADIQRAEIAAEAADAETEEELQWLSDRLDGADARANELMASVQSLASQQQATAEMMAEILALLKTAASIQTPSSAATPEPVVVVAEPEGIPPPPPVADADGHPAVDPVKRQLRRYFR